MGLWKQMNLLCKYGVRSQNPLALKVKVLETSVKKSRICSVFIVSSNHQYSTLRNEKTLSTNLLLNRRLLASSVTSCGLLSTDDGSKVQDLHLDDVSRNYYGSTEVTHGATIKNVPGDVTADPAVNSVGPLQSGNSETVFSSGNLSENLDFSQTDVASVLDSAEVPLTSLGLGGWTPVGLVQRFIELLHVQLDIPWWAAIVAATFVARIIMFPIIIKTQQNTARMSNYMPQLQVLQQKFHRARCSGDAIAAHKCGMEMQVYMQKHNINPLKSAFIPLCQAPVFISFFLGLRSMAKLPVESFKTGGLWWITDLTIPDPYYITPLVTCGTLFIVIKLGAESGVKVEHMKLARYVLTALPIFILPFTINFPAAVLCYWTATNVFTLGAVSLLKIEKVQEFFNIPKKKPIHPDFATKKKGFVEGMKEAYQDQKMLNAMEDRSRIDSVRFKKAGTGPVPRTYSYDPTKPRPVAAAAARKVQAKEYKP